MYMIAEVSQYVAVASFTEAWIEIKCAAPPPCGVPVASFTEAWIEIRINSALSTLIRCRLLHGGVDWNLTPLGRAERDRRRLLHGGVDWNSLPLQSFVNLTPSRLLHGGVDWNFYSSFCSKPHLSRLLHGGVDWNYLRFNHSRWYIQSPPSRRRGLK